MANNVERVRNVIYQLYSEPFGLKTIQEPVGYNNDTRGYARDKDSKGFTVKTDIDLEFYGDGAEYISNLESIYGIQMKCTLTKFERDRYSISEQFKVRYIQELDLGSLKKDNRTGKVTVNATEGGLYADIKNRYRDEYDLLNNESADGVDIGGIKTYKFKPRPRSLFLESNLKKTDVTDYKINARQFKAIGSKSESSRTIPLEIVYESGDGVQNPYNASEGNNTVTSDQNYQLGTVQSVGNQFYWRSDIDREITFKLDLDFVLNNKTIAEKTKEFNRNFLIEITLSKKDELDDTNDLLYKRIVIDQFEPMANIGVPKSYSIKETLSINEGDSIGIVFSTIGEKSVANGRMYFEVSLDVSKAELIIEDSTDYAPTESRCMKPLDFFNRIISKITGRQNVVTSSIFEDGGEYANMVVDNGFWGRGFPDSYVDSNDDEQTIQMKTSFKDAFESFSYLEPLCWFTYFEGNEEKIRIEKATYTQQNFIGVDLGSVDNVNEESSKMDYFKNVILGHSESMEYEELSGLDEPNGKSEMSTFITRSESTYEVLSKYRTDAVGYELIRRKPFEKYPKEDTSRDDNIWIHDAKLSSDGSYTHNIWSDILDELPKGVFRPDNIWNFRLSPMNRLYYGHGYNVKRSLYHFPKKYIRFSSSNANQNLSTTINGVTIKENGNLLVSDLPKPKVEPKKVNFTFKMNQLIEDKLLGHTKIGNELIPNYFGLIKYKENGEEKYGRLIKLESKEEAKMTIIKARL